MGLAPLAAAQVMEPAPEPAAAAARGWRFGLEQSLGHDDNPLRRPLGDPLHRGDRFGTTAADLAWSSTISRQALSAWVRGERTGHDRLDALDRNAHAAQASWDLRLAGDWGGRLWWRRQDDLAEGLRRVDPVTGRRVEQRIEQSAAYLTWGVNRAWALQGEFLRDEVQDETRGRWRQSVSQDTAAALLRWRADERWNLAVGVRDVQGQQDGSEAAPWPGRLPYEQRWSEVRLQWDPSPPTRLTLRASRGHGTSGDLAVAEGSETDTRARRDLRSARLDLRWQPLASLVVNGRLWRDDGLQTQVLQTLGDQARLTAGSGSGFREGRLELGWDPGARLRVTLGLQRLDRQQTRSWAGSTAADATQILGWQDLRDRTWRRQVVVAWAVSPAWRVSCRVQDERRSATDLAGAVLPVWPGHEARAVLCLLRGEIGGRRFREPVDEVG